MDKVDFFIHAVYVMKSGNKLLQESVNKIISKSLEEEKAGNIYSNKVILTDLEKKLIKATLK